MSKVSSLAKNSYKLFVGNLAWTVGSQDLKMHFSKFGFVSDAVVIFDTRTGFSKSYGFVVFGTRDGYNTAKNKSNQLLDGKILRIQESNN